MGVCTSGAATGVHCNIFIDITGVTFTSTCPGEQFVTGISIAGQADGGVAAGAGDSGGPAFTLTGPDNSQVQAAGIISVGWDEVPCQTFGSVCFNMIGFTDIDTLKAAHGANVLVLPAASGGGVSTISMLSFAGLNLLWMLLALSRKLKNGQVQAR